MLLIISIFAGILTALVIRRTTDMGALRQQSNRIHAHLLEFRLFFDEPRLIWGAQLDLLRANARLLWLLLPSTLILALPMTWLFLQLEGAYGYRSLHPGEAALVTAQLTRRIQATDHFALQGVGSVAVETPPIRVAHDNQVAWRIRPTGVGDGAVDLTVAGQVMRKTVSGSIRSPRRFRSLLECVLHPAESRLSDAGVEWLEVDYPRTGSDWILWFLSLSTVTALICALPWRSLHIM